MSGETFERIRPGKQNPMMAYMTGKLKVTGDVRAAMALQTAPLAAAAVSRLSGAVRGGRDRVALFSAWHSLNHMRRLLDREQAVLRALTPAERRQEPVTAVGLDGQIFDFYASLLARGDRVYFQVMPSGFSSDLDLPTIVAALGRFYLLPAVQTDDLRKATVVVSYFADPALLHVKFITQVARRAAAALRLADPGAVTAHDPRARRSRTSLMLVLGCGLLPFLRLAAAARELLTRAAARLRGRARRHRHPRRRARGRPRRRSAGSCSPLLAAASLAARAPPRSRRRGARCRGPGRGDARAARPSSALHAAARRPGRAAVRRQAAPRVRTAGGSGALRARALYDFGHPVAPGVHRPALPGAPASAAPARRSRRSTSASWARSTARPSTFSCSRSRSASSAAPGRCCADDAAAPARRDAARARDARRRFFNQLQTNYADVPLAMFAALGVAALATWLRTGRSGLLPAAALFLARRGADEERGRDVRADGVRRCLARRAPAQRRPLAARRARAIARSPICRGGSGSQVNHVKIAEYSLSNLFNPRYLSDHADRVGPAAHELWTQIWAVGSWSYLVPLTLLALAAALVLRRFRPRCSASAGCCSRSPDCVAIYWISTNTVESNLSNSSDRTIDSLVLGGRPARAGAALRRAQRLRKGREARSCRGGRRPNERHPLGAGDRAPRRLGVEADERADAHRHLLAVDAPDARAADDDRDLLLPVPLSSCSRPSAPGGSSNQLMPNASTPSSRRTKRTAPPGPAGSIVRDVDDASTPSAGPRLSVSSAHDPGSVRRGADAAPGWRRGARRGRLRALRRLSRRGRRRRHPRARHDGGGDPAHGRRAQARRRALPGGAAGRLPSPSTAGPRRRPTRPRSRPTRPRPAPPRSR